MGIIIRQGLKQSFVNLTMAVVGFAAVMFIYPLDKEAYGMARFLMDTGILLTPFILLGSQSIAIKFYPALENGFRKANGLMALTTGITVIGCILFLLLVVIFKNNIQAFFDSKGDLFIRYGWYCIPIAIIASFINLYASFAYNFQRIVFPAIFQQFIKITLPIAIILIVYYHASLDAMVWIIIGTFLLNLAAVIIYLMHLGGLDFKINIKAIQKENLKGMISFGLFAIIGSAGSMLAIRLDSVIVPSLLNLKSNGIFGIAAVMVSFMMIPITSLIGIATPIISKAINDNNWNLLEDLYKKSSINSMIPALFMGLCLSSCAIELFQLMPKGHEMIPAIPVLYLLIIARIIDVSTGFNNEILAYSKYYKYNIALLFILAISNFTMCKFFIVNMNMGIVGAALGTFISLILYNGIKLVLIKYLFRIQPFSASSIQLVIFSIALFFGLYFLPLGHLPNLFKIAIKCMIIAISFFSFVFYSKISNDFNLTALQILKYFKIK